MNCSQFNKIQLEEILQNLGHFPTKQNEKEAWYLNPFASENHASFKLNKRINYWYLFSEGIGGNNVDFMKKYLKASISEVLEWADNQNFSSFQNQKKNFLLQSEKKNYEILMIQDVQNKNLINYLKQRGLTEIVFPFIKEIHFKMNNKELYAVGFQNKSEGWELRNAFFKGSIHKKDVSLLKHKSENLYVFEGFMDALSFIELKKGLHGNLLILNSVSMYENAKEILKNYSNVFLFLDNDLAGRNLMTKFSTDFPEAVDCAYIYAGFNDLNDYLIQQTNEVQHEYKSTFKR